MATTTLDEDATRLVNDICVDAAELLPGVVLSLVASQDDALGGARALALQSALLACGVPSGEVGPGKRVRCGEPRGAADGGLRRVRVALANSASASEDSSSVVSRFTPDMKKMLLVDPSRRWLDGGPRPACGSNGAPSFLSRRAARARGVPCRSG
jgi:hypothetical protein